MSWKSEARKRYEERVVNESLARLSERFELKRLPFSADELKTLAARSRDSFKNPAKNSERLDKFKTQLAKTHPADLVAKVSATLEEINNAIGYEEK
jgi:hypothetical protein